jgi:tRNA modification GTPase
MSYPTCALDDTIAAIASAPGGGARGIVRLSGPAVVTCLADCFAADSDVDCSKVAAASMLSGRLRLEGWASDLPCHVLLWPNGRSYTGQAVAEIHTIGSPPFLEATLRSVCRGGARLAEPGEFTLRAFLSGRIDLTQAEAVLGVIDAAGPEELDTALGQLAGGLARPLHRLREQLVELLAHVEAGFDFPEEDLPFITREELDRRLAESADAVERIATQLTTRNTSSPVLRAVLLGRPNAGKSSLFNALAGAGALVSSQPGTTRDYLVAELDLDGLKCQLVDTAGVEPTLESLASATQSMTTHQARDAWLRLVCIDSTRPLDAWDHQQLTQGHQTQIVVFTKTDAAPVSLFPRVAPRNDDGRGAEDEGAARPIFPAVRTSATTGEGLDGLLRALRQAAESASPPGLSAVAGTAARCGESLRLAAQCLAQAREVEAEELAALEIRAALDELGTVVGAVYTEDLLHRVFSRFCVGK